MKSRLADVIHNARCCAGMTVEYAAGCIGITPRSIYNYEAGRMVPDQIVAKMVRAYSSPDLGYHYLSHELETGRLLLPPAIPAGAASRSIRLRMAMDHVKALQQELDAICMDDVIDDAERQTLSGTIGKYVELAAACISIMLMAGFTQNKNALAGGPEHLKEMCN